jgi:HSP20 family molecular chaperone IbpA
MMQNPLDWREFEAYMKKQFSGWPIENWEKQIERQQEWARQYMQKMIAKWMPDFRPNPLAWLDFNIFETHRNIIVRVHVPSGLSHDQLKFAVSPRALRVSMQEHSETIVLGANVIPERSKAEYKQGCWEIRMPKAQKREKFHPIFP